MMLVYLLRVLFQTEDYLTSYVCTNVEFYRQCKPNKVQGAWTKTGSGTFASWRFMLIICH